jgi:hypothetical protein
MGALIGTTEVVPFHKAKAKYGMEEKHSSTVCEGASWHSSVEGGMRNREASYGL